MEKAVNQIYLSLQKLLELHRQLLDAVTMERNALVAADLKDLLNSTQAKEGLIQLIRAQENERAKFTSELVMIWKRPLRELSLTNIILALQVYDPKGAEQMQSVYTAISILIARISETNEYNKGLVERSLEHIHQMKKNILGEASPRSNTYTQQGQRSNNAGNSRLLSQEA